MEDPLLDAETLKLDDTNNIIELGKKTNTYDDIEGQYIGLIKIKGCKTKEVINFYNSLDKEVLYDNTTYPNMYMTSFLQLIINQLMPVKAILINGGWLEIDSIKDLNSYNKIYN